MQLLPISFPKLLGPKYVYLAQNVIYVTWMGISMLQTGVISYVLTSSTDRQSVFCKMDSKKWNRTYCDRADHDRAT